MISCPDNADQLGYQQEISYVQKLTEQRLKFQAFKADFDKLTLALADRDQKIAELKELLDQAKSCRQQLQQQRMNRESLQRELRAAERKMQSDAQKSRLQLINALEEQAACRRSLQFQFRSKIQERQLRIKQLQFSLSQLQLSFSENQHKHKQHEASLKLNSDSLKRQLQAEERNRQQLLNENNLLTGRLKSSLSELSCRNEQLQRQQEKVDELVRSCNQKDQIIEEFKLIKDQQHIKNISKFLDEKQQKEKLQTLLFIQKKSFAQQQLRVEQLQVRNDQLRRTLASESKKYQESSNQNRHLRQMINNCSSQLGFLKKESDSLRKQRSGLTSKLKHFQNTLYCDRKSKHQLDSLRRELQSRRKSQLQLMDSLFLQLEQTDSKANCRI